jgi:rubrerythrin
VSDQFYLQDSRSYVGNDMLFWAVKGNGYVTDVSKAEVYTKAEAVAQHQCRETDIPWPKDYIDAKTRPAVDMQYVKRDEALAGTGIEIIKPRKLKRKVCNCHSCGSFLSQIQVFTECPKCGAENRP